MQLMLGILVLMFVVGPLLLYQGTRPTRTYQCLLPGRADLSDD